ncbi:hypothetical protein JOF29_008329 [Kribbella aluminosa]|uniref:Uncharacterized protein n=1 Tax=Kribbella aluminosa TaxID=416017 RepID=A0ABS4V0E0_9ACTN|nr:hypothetical protein [Kribbella aluminosa]MBP2357219.1 hypothetical protein [Kribbella aluminosa]
MRRSISRLATATASLALLSGAAAAPALADQAGTPGAPGVGDTVFPNLGNGGYQADHYLIEMGYDASTQLIDATMTMTATPTQNLSRFDLDSYGLDIKSVEVNGRPAIARRLTNSSSPRPARSVRRSA